MYPDMKIVNLIVPTTAITAASTANSGYVDTRGFDYLQICLSEMSASAATRHTGLRVREDDTVPTAFTDMSAIIALCGAAATSTSAGFQIPIPSSVTDNIYRFNIDLKGRKRYIGLDFIPAVTTRASAVALLLRTQDGPGQSASTDAAITTTVASCRLKVAI